MNMRWTWVQGNGGPLLLLSKNHLCEWQGSDPPSNGRVVEAIFRWDGPGSIATDYDRACDVEGYINVIKVGQSDAVVLGEGDYRTTWWSGNLETSGILVRGIGWDSLEDIIEVLNQPDAIPWQDMELRFTVEEPPFVLFDSSEVALDEILGDSIGVPLSCGAYRIKTAFYSPHPKLSLILHRFVTEDEKASSRFISD